MAAASTPRKPVINFDQHTCSFCLSVSRRLFCYANNKAKQLNVRKIAEWVAGRDLSTIESCLYICDPCLNFVEKLEFYRGNIRKHLADLESLRSKRCAKTPPYSLQESFEEEISESVEKLKISGHTEKRSRRKISFSNDYLPDTVSESVNTPNDHSQQMFIGLEHSYTKSFDTVEEINSSVKESVEEILSRYDQNCFTFTGMNNQLSQLSSSRSVLYKKDALNLSSSDVFSHAFLELESGCPFLFECLLTAVGDKIDSVSKIATISTIYGMILHCRNVKVSCIQRLYTTLAIRYNADNKLLSKLNLIHLTLTEDSKRNIVDGFGKQSEDSLIREIAARNNGKFNGDNLDMRVTTNDIRMNIKDKDYHFFATDFTLDRVKTEHLSDEVPHVDTVPTEAFLLSSDEVSSYKETLKILLGKEIKHLRGFQWMDSILPCHIQHPLQEEMSEKSKIFVLPVALRNEASYSDCIKILDECALNLNRWYTKAGRAGELESLRVPFGGDQLTRVRLQGAKSLRAGAHTATERFDNLHPIVCELFHTLQDFLEPCTELCICELTERKQWKLQKLCKKFLNLKHARDIGTLPNLKIHIQRVNVNGNVKSRYKAHEDFILTCGQAYFLSYVMRHFHMNDLHDKPSHPSISDSINNWNNVHKMKVFNTIMDEVVAELFIPFSAQRDGREILVQGTVLTPMGPDVLFKQKTKVTGETVKINISLNDVQYLITTNEQALKQGCTVQLGAVKLRLVKLPGDDLQNYVLNFLQWYFVIIMMKDAIREGDTDRICMLLKHMIPFFYSHSELSKYMAECIDYILKVEHVLSPKLAVRVKAGSVVNPKGKLGKNKAADLQKENQVKFLKTLIRTLGANKTENAITSITKAAPTILAVCDNFDKMMKLKTVDKTHKSRSRDEDIRAILDKLTELNLWTFQESRVLDLKVAGSPFDFDSEKFTAVVSQTVKRLLRNLPVIESDSEAESDDELVDV